MRHGLRAMATDSVSRYYATPLMPAAAASYPAAAD